jgi:hypothetical protein
MYFNFMLELFSAMVIRLCAVVLLTPAFLAPGLALVIIGGWLGRVFLGAQMAVKRENSTAKAPVMGHFGAAIAGLSEFYFIHAPIWLANDL